MSLVHCRACDHLVDTSAEACPGCGATNPGQKISRQQRDRRIFLIQFVVGVVITIAAVSAAWSVAGPIIKQQLSKSAAG